jgi:hypothetical protein
VWQKYSLIDKKFYVSAYIQTDVELSIMSKETQKIE